jgi:hypothetical protein
MARALPLSALATVAMAAGDARSRARELGIRPGVLEPGPTAPVVAREALSLRPLRELLAARVAGAPGG